MQKSVILIKNATVAGFYPPTIHENQVIVIEDDKIAHVGKDQGEWKKFSEVVDLEGAIISPGLVCAHNHFYSTLARGIIATIKPSNNFVEILENLWWRLDRAIDEKILFSSAMIGALEAIKCGVTSVVDHHASPNFIDGSLDVLSDAFKRAGLRGILAYEVTDRNGKKGRIAGIKENTRFAKSSKDFPLISAAIGAHAPFTLDEDTIEQLADVIKDHDSGIHIHVAEDKWDVEHSQQIYKKTPIDRIGLLLNKKAIIAHGVHLNAHDRKYLLAKEATLVHNPRSNMNNQIGYLNPGLDLENIALGTDGIGSDMIAEMQFAFFKNRDAGGNMIPDDFVRFLHNGNHILSRYFQKSFGHIEPGFQADLTIWDYPSPTPLLDLNWPGHLIFGFSDKFVNSVMVAGKFVYRDRKFPFSKEDVYAQARHQAKRLWRHMDEL